MNIANLEFIAEWLEAGAPHRGKVKSFDMSVGVKIDALDVVRKEDGSLDVPACGTACCIAGAATQFFNDFDESIIRSAIDGVYDNFVSAEADWDEVFHEARDLLGLTHKQACELFVPIGTDDDSIFPNWETSGKQWHEFNKPDLAAKVIRNLIETGEVNWEIEL